MILKRWQAAKVHLLQKPKLYRKLRNGRKATQRSQRKSQTTRTLRWWSSSSHWMAKADANLRWRSLLKLLAISNRNNRHRRRKGKPTKSNRWRKTRLAISKSFKQFQIMRHLKNAAAAIAAVRKLKTRRNSLSRSSSSLPKVWMMI